MRREWSQACEGFTGGWGQGCHPCRSKRVGGLKWHLDQNKIIYSNLLVDRNKPVD